MRATLYTVTGYWPFPEAMLRHDRAKPATAADEAALRAASAHSKPPGEQQEFRITLVSNRMHGLLQESADRWASYGWCSSLASAEQHLEYRAPSTQAAFAKSVKLELPVEEAQLLERLRCAALLPATEWSSLEEHQSRLALLAAMRVRQALEKSQVTSDDSETCAVGALIELLMRYIDACALLGRVARQIEDENDRNAIEHIMKDCARSFTGAVEVAATDDGGWSVKVAAAADLVRR